MPFVKLDCGILNSTLWIDRLAREVFITALLMAEPREITEAMPQIAITSLDLTGWIVPPGWYGFVPAAGSGILHRARVDEGDVGTAALTRLSDPDPESRSSSFDGRRMVRVNGGFIVLNFIAYREKDATTAERSKRWRERQKLRNAPLTNTRVSVSVTRDSTPGDTIAEAEAEAEAEVLRKDIAPAALLSADADFEAFRQQYPASRRVGGKLAQRAWKAATKDRNGTHLQLMRTALDQHKRSEQWQTPKLIPLMTTWLNQERWNQTLPEPRAFGVTPKTAGNAASLQRFVDKHR